MCTVSMIMDDWNKRNPIYDRDWDKVSRLEYDLLKKEVEALKELIKAAKNCAADYCASISTRLNV